MIVKPQKLPENGTIGIVSPSSPAASIFKKRFNRGLKSLQNLGFKIKLGKHVTNKFGYMSGSPEERAADINSMFLDKDVDAIFTTIGGYNSNQLLDLLDYEAIKRNPKIFVGYSDTTALLLGIYKKTNLVTFHGPAVMTQFGEFPKVFEYTVENMKRVICSNKPEIILKASDMWTGEHPDWSKFDSMPRRLVENKGWKFLKDGEAYGNLIGGNLQTIQILIGTKYFPSFKNSIFFWEETEASTAEVDRTLNHFRHVGIFDEIKGMIVGRIDSDLKISDKEYGLNKIILDVTKEYDFPIITEVDFGHTDPMLTLPIGINCRINSSNKSLILKDNAVI